MLLRIYAVCLLLLVAGLALLWSGWYAASTGEVVIHRKGKAAIVAHAAGPNEKEFKFEVAERFVLGAMLALLGGGSFAALLGASSERKARAVAAVEQYWRRRRERTTLPGWFIGITIVGVIAVFLYAAVHGT